MHDEAQNPRAAAILELTLITAVQSGELAIAGLLSEQAALTISTRLRKLADLLDLAESPAAFVQEINLAAHIVRRSTP